MKVETVDREAILEPIEKLAEEITTLVAPLTEEQFNQVPYSNGWTAAQLLIHLTKSTSAIATSMQAPVPPADRPADERVEELKTVFLDFSSKMQSPDMIQPAPGVYAKQSTVDNFQRAYADFQSAATFANLTGLIVGLPLGDATKFELLNFILFHTCRHLHQLQKICKALSGSETKN